MNLLERIKQHLRQLAPDLMQRDSVILLHEAEQEIEILGAAIIAMAEDGWLYHGAYGMDDVQTKCYEAYLRVKPSVEVRKEVWKPIETAPKDGSEILLLGKLCIADGFFDGKYWVWPYLNDEPLYWMSRPEAPNVKTAYEQNY